MGISIDEDIVKKLNLFDANDDIYLFNFEDFIRINPSYENILVSEEIKYMNMILNERYKKIFCFRKYMTRLVLSRYLHISPNKIQFYYNDYLKPYAKSSSKDSVFFNISHSKNYLLVGVSLLHDIGVDIEYKHTFTKKNNELLRNIYHQEEWEQCRKLKKIEQLLMLSRTWIQKEAISKSIGMGLCKEFSEINLAHPKIEESGCKLYQISEHTIEVEVVENSQLLFAIAKVVISKGVTNN